ncbi:hypothetical protein [Cesiribacter sp. SM1]|uniref:hypothetical protein n=1 Tax=Cesiribacter sp. SM1 TaxID=2861196 RepID=UPI001CD7F537|nr:hypothetical protein [Cesiribacter sp. SM1]
MQKSFFSLLLCALLMGAAHMATAQQLSLQPYAGIGLSLMKDKTLDQTWNPPVWGGGHASLYNTTDRDLHYTLPAPEAGLRTQLQVANKWSLRLETGLQQMRYRRRVEKTLYTSGNMQYSFAESDIELLFLHQSLEGAYSVTPRILLSAGGYAGTLLTSVQNMPLFPPEAGTPGTSEAYTKAGHGLRDTQLGLKASLSYELPLGITTTAGIRQSLQSLYTAEAQPAGPIKPISFSLTVGYKFKVKSQPKAAN